MFTVFIIMFVIRVATYATYRRFYLSLAFSKKRVFYRRIAYFNHAVNLLKHFDKLLKINK